LTAIQEQNGWINADVMHGIRIQITRPSVSGWRIWVRARDSDDWSTWNGLHLSLMQPG
jgi:hypothetical protein